MAEEMLAVQVSPHYLRKMRTFFNGKNQAVKGVLSKYDYELFADRYKELAKVNTLREQQARRKILKIWEDFFESTSKLLPITPEVFAKCVSFMEKSRLTMRCANYADCVFDLIDLNADGQIAPSEFRVFHKLYLLNDETADAAFKVLDKGNKGYITYDEFVDAIVKFFRTGTDTPTPEDIVFGPLVN